MPLFMIRSSHMCTCMRWLTQISLVIIVILSLCTPWRNTCNAIQQVCCKLLCTFPPMVPPRLSF
jgi:hypothetical protein